MTERNMNIEMFERLALIHGGEIAAWPAPHRAGAQAFAAGSGPARAALGQARALDDALGALAAETPPPAPDALRARILADADRALAARAPDAEILRPVFGRRRSARWIGPMALAASAAIGVFTGWSAPSNLTAALVSASAMSAPSGNAGAWTGDSFMSADLMPGDDLLAE
jgi:hypothetical protein